ncbi:MAG: rod shape-determining protein MreC [Caldiserica bacterium]|jgi:rod shape-determining protein MreC|nr:rod shape-determining protein MreC [Caldisericota bacterium]
MPGPVRKLSRRSTSLLFIALFLALATIIGLASYGVTLGGLVLSGAQRVTRTLSRAVATAADSVAGYGRALLFARGIYAENETLRSENQYLDARLRLALDNHDELERLQAQLAVQQRLPVKSVLAQVTGRATGVRSMDVFIDHGTALGIADGAGVFVADFTGQAYVFGKVRDAFTSNATVIPLLDSRCVISGINRRTGEDVLVKGVDGEYCELSYISPLPQFQSGDIVVTSSSSATFPPNIPIGWVDTLTIDTTTRLVLRPFADVWAARYLLVMQGSK